MLWGLVFILASTESLTIYNRTCPEVCQCEDFITNCGYNGLTSLPEEVDVNVISLDLSCNSFENFPNLGTFTSLKYLNMSHNRISTLMYSDFKGLENLERLDFTFNLFHDWKDIHSSTFVPTKKLTYLDFSNNPLRSISKQSNHLYIESLTILRLTNCSMKSIPVKVFNRLANLRELHLADNPITSINDSFEIDTMKFIDLSRCHLNFIQENAFASLQNLETLVLHNNIYLKEFACHSDSLIYLDLSDCTLESIPSSNLRNLNTLDLSGNFLKTIPSRSFSTYPQLQTLNLSTNAITAVEETAFRDLNELRNLDLSLNKLTVISEKTFYFTTSLLRLNLSHNYISSIDSITSNSLKLLDASYCEIYSLNKLSFTNMPNLISLSLSRNFISVIPDGLYGKSLVYLDVSSCRIKSLNNKSFEEMYSLRHIDLAGNLLTTADPSYFPRALTVNIDNNPWRCECPKLKRMFEWLETYSTARINSLICDSPDKFEGKSWREACYTEWYPNHTRKDTLWWYSVAVVIAMVVLLLAVVAIRRIHHMKEKRLRQIEENRRAEEREALRRMQRIQREYREEESRNAPDPREIQRPPSYTEALLLPRLDASAQTLSGSLHSVASRPSLRGSNSDISKKTRVRRKRRRRKSEMDERRASRTAPDSDSSEQETQIITIQPPLESDF